MIQSPPVESNSIERELVRPIISPQPEWSMAFQMALALVITIALLESFFATFHIGEQEYLKINSVLGLTHLENKLICDRSEAFSLSTTNRFGMCDVEHSIKSVAGVERVALLGDSMTEALQVPMQERFSSVLQRKLNLQSKSNFEVLNFGTGGFSTGQEYLQYVRDVRPFKPKVVVLVFHQGDELENTPFNSIWSMRPCFTVAKEGTMSIRWREFDTWRNTSSSLPLTLFDWGRRHSHIWQALIQAHSIVKADPIIKRVTGWVFDLARVPLGNEERDRDITANEAGLKVDNGPLNAIEDGNEQWHVTLSIVQKLAALCEQDHCRLIVVGLPNRDRCKDFANQFQAVKALADANHFPATDLTPAFDHAQAPATNPLYLAAHLSPRGHELVANGIYAALKTANVLP